VPGGPVWISIGVLLIFRREHLAIPWPRRLIILRVENGFLLQIGLGAANRSEEFRFMNPSLNFDDEFLKAYDAESRILNVSWPSRK
jgi:hypothetical protein